MGAFTKNVEFIREVAQLLVDVFQAGIHVAVHIGRGRVLIGFIMNKARRVRGVDPVVHFDAVLAVIALVAERPNDDGYVVSESVDKLLGSVDVCTSPFAARSLDQGKDRVGWGKDRTYVLLDVHCEAP